MHLAQIQRNWKKKKKLVDNVWNALFEEFKLNNTFIVCLLNGNENHIYSNDSIKLFTKI